MFGQLGFHDEQKLRIKKQFTQSLFQFERGIRSLSLYDYLAAITSKVRHLESEIEAKMEELKKEHKEQPPHWLRRWIVDGLGKLNKNLAMATDEAIGATIDLAYRRPTTRRTSNLANAVIAFDEAMEFLTKQVTAIRLSGGYQSSAEMENVVSETETENQAKRHKADDSSDDAREAVLSSDDEEQNAIKVLTPYLAIGLSYVACFVVQNPSVRVDRKGEHFRQIVECVKFAGLAQLGATDADVASHMVDAYESLGKERKVIQAADAEDTLATKVGKGLSYAAARVGSVFNTAEPVDKLVSGKRTALLDGFFSNRGDCFPSCGRKFQPIVQASKDAEAITRAKQTYRQAAAEAAKAASLKPEGVGRKLGPKVKTY